MWSERDRISPERIAMARAAEKLYETLFVGPMPFRPIEAIERHGYVWDLIEREWRYDPGEAARRGHVVDYGKTS
jgi:hypothetical protein